MIPVKLNQQAFNFPQEVNELNLKQFFALRNATDILDEICAITGLNRQSVQNFKSADDLKTCRQLLNNLGQKINQGFNANKLPKTVTLGNKTIKIPTNLKLEPVGAFIAVHNLITDEHKRNAENDTEFDPTNLVPLVLAHYFWLPYQGQDALYNDELIEDEAYMNLILALPITEGIPVANFFFQKYPDL